MNDESASSFDDFAHAAIPRLRRLAYAWCRDWHRADDLVQDTLERVYGAWPRVRREVQPFAYARTTMLRRLISEQRRPWRRREVAGLTAGVHEATAPATDMIANLDLLDAISALPPRQRAVILLRYVEDLGVEETADLLHCSEGTIKSQTHHARAALRRHLGPDYDTHLSPPAGPAAPSTHGAGTAARTVTTTQTLPLRAAPPDHGTAGGTR